jgi:TRAP-type mannitol/chloroaromatic compound transport system permease small subunit
MVAVVRAIERSSAWSGVLAAWLLVPLIAATVYDVAARYAFNAPTQWAYEVGYMMMGAQALLGMAYTLRHAGHIRIDAISGRFSERAKAAIDLVSYVVLLLPVIVWMTWSLWDYWVKALVTSELSGQSAWNPIIWPFKLTFFVAFVLLVLQVLAEVIKATEFLLGRRPHYLGGGDQEAI